jgi:hypothetical protein
MEGGAEEASEIQKGAVRREMELQNVMDEGIACPEINRPATAGGSRAGDIMVGRMAKERGERLIGEHCRPRGIRVGAFG